MLKRPKEDPPVNLRGLRRHEYWQQIWNWIQVRKHAFCYWSLLPLFFRYANLVPNCSRLFLCWLLGRQNSSFRILEKAHHLRQLHVKKDPQLDEVYPCDACDCWYSDVFELIHLPFKSHLGESRKLFTKLSLHWLEGEKLLLIAHRIVRWDSSYYRFNLWHLELRCKTNLLLHQMLQTRYWFKSASVRW